MNMNLNTIKQYGSDAVQYIKGHKREVGITVGITALLTFLLLKFTKRN